MSAHSRAASPSRVPCVDPCAQDSIRDREVSQTDGVIGCAIRNRHSVTIE